MGKLSTPRPDSVMARWLAAGGNIHASYEYRSAHPELYPYLDADVEPLVNFTTLGYAAGFLACTLLMLYMFIALFSGSPSRSGQAAAVPSDTPTMEFLPTVSVLYLPTAAPSAARIMERLPQDAIAVFTAAPTLTPSATSTETPTATYTPSPTATLTYTPSSTPICSSCDVVAVSVRVGWFYPPLGGNHCPAGISDCSDFELISGDSWYLVRGLAAACPSEFPLNSYLEVYGVGVYQCLQRLDLAKCDYVSDVCDILVLSSDAVVPDWHQIYNGVLYVR